MIESDYLIPVVNSASCLVPCPEPCPADVNGDTEVGFDDLVVVLADWGSCSGCAADIDASGVVDFNDLLVLLGDFGPCEDPLPVGFLLQLGWDQPKRVARLQRTDAHFYGGNVADQHAQYWWGVRDFGLERRRGCGVYGHDRLPRSRSVDAVHRERRWIKVDG